MPIHIRYYMQYSKPYHRAYCSYKLYLSKRIHQKEWCCNNDYMVLKISDSYAQFSEGQLNRMDLVQGNGVLK